MFGNNLTKPVLTFDQKYCHFYRNLGKKLHIGCVQQKLFYDVHRITIFGKRGILVLYLYFLDPIFDFSSP